MKQPKPIAKGYECSLCGEDWDLHGDDPKVEDCIRILKAKANAVTIIDRLPMRPYVGSPYTSDPWVYPWPKVTYSSSTSAAVN